MNRHYENTKHVCPPVCMNWPYLVCTSLTKATQLFHLIVFLPLTAHHKSFTTIGQCIIYIRFTIIKTRNLSRQKKSALTQQLCHSYVPSMIIDHHFDNVWFGSFCGMSYRLRFFVCVLTDTTNTNHLFLRKKHRAYFDFISLRIFFIVMLGTHDRAMSCRLFQKYVLSKMAKVLLKSNIDVFAGMSEVL